MLSLTISGLSGTGTTTIAKMLLEELGIRYVYTGDIFRQMARERGMDVTEFGDYVSDHPEIDRELDRRQVELARETDILIEGRLAGYMAYSSGAPSYKIWLDATPVERARRVAGREAKDIAGVVEENRRREEGNRQRYLTIYDFDIDDTSFYDINIDTTGLTPGAIFGMIISDMRKKGLIEAARGDGF